MVVSQTVYFVLGGCLKQHTFCWDVFQTGYFGMGSVKNWIFCVWQRLTQYTLFWDVSQTRYFVMGVVLKRIFCLVLASNRIFVV